MIPNPVNSYQSLENTVEDDNHNDDVTDNHISKAKFQASDSEFPSVVFDADYEELIFFGRKLPVFRANVLYSSYKSYQRNQIDFIAAAPCIASVHMIGISRFNWHNLGTDGFLFHASIGCFIIFVAFYYMFIAASLLSKYYPEMDYGKLSKNMLATWFYGYIEDFLSITISISVCVLLMARVHQGQCESMTDIWRS